MPLDAFGWRPLAEKFLQPKQFWGLEFREGWVFGTVVARRILRYKPYKVISTTSSGVATAVTVSSLSSQLALQLLDSRNTQNDVPYLATNLSTQGGYPWWMHFGFGVKQKYIYCYPRYPASKEYDGLWPNLTVPNPANGDYISFVNAEKSPYMVPSEASEMAIVPGVHMDMSYYNQDPYGRAYQPELNLLACLYFNALFDPANADDARYIRSIANGGVGYMLRVGFGTVPIDYSALEGDWEVEPLPLPEARSLSPSTPSTTGSVQTNPQIINPRTIAARNLGVRPRRVG